MIHGTNICHYCGSSGREEHKPDCLWEKVRREMADPVNRAIANSPPPLGDVGDDVTDILDAGMGMLKGDELRVFETGASRDTEKGKLDFEGFLSPTVLQCYAEYMHRHRTTGDGSLRDGDNWQKGIPLDVYMKSMWRHFFAVWADHRADYASPDSLCALLFNVMGYLHEVLKI